MAVGITVGVGVRVGGSAGVAVGSSIVGDASEGTVGFAVAPLSVHPAAAINVAMNATVMNPVHAFCFKCLAPSLTYIPVEG